MAESKLAGLLCAHHYFHIGEIATKRSRLGQRVGDYPGPLEDCV